MIVIRYIPQDSYSVLFLGAKSSAQHTEFEGIVRVVFASVAMGMGIDLKGVMEHHLVLRTTISRQVGEEGEVEHLHALLSMEAI